MTKLSAMSRGIVKCLGVEGDGPAVTRLKRLGICSGRRIEVVQTGDPMILRIVGARIGLSRQLASLVTVEPIAGETSDKGGAVADRESSQR